MKKIHIFFATALILILLSVLIIFLKEDKEIQREKLAELLELAEDKYESVETLKAVEYEKYTEKEILVKTKFSSIHGYLLIPKLKEEKYPVILAMHGHGNNYALGAEEVVGRKGNLDLSYGKELAERGYVVLATNVPLFGYYNFNLGINPGEERNSGDIREQLNAQNLIQEGLSMMSVVMRDDMAAIDFLETLDFADTKKIGCIGHSFGGERCMYLMALDKRVKTGSLLNSVHPLNLKVENGIKYTWYIIIPGIRKDFTIEKIIDLIMPRKTLIFNTKDDPILPITEVRKVIKNLDNKEITFLEVNGKHEFLPEYHEEVYDFLDKQLKEN
ncbi:MAG: dienelactone hydrolase family protein [Nanoarchaeota archaeon]